MVPLRPSVRGILGADLNTGYNDIIQSSTPQLRRIPIEFERGPIAGLTR